MVSSHHNVGLVKIISKAEWSELEYLSRCMASKLWESFANLSMSTEAHLGFNVELAQVLLGQCTPGCNFCNVLI